MTQEEILKINQENVFTGLSPRGYGYTCFANKDFNIGDFIMHGYGKLLDHQTGHCSIQIDKNKHYMPTKWTGKYWNHSCDPNAYMNTRNDGFPNLYALKKIKKGDEITYSYWMSEFSWVKGVDELSVKCICGSKKCKGSILAFNDLSQKEKENLVFKKHCAKYLFKCK